MVEVGMRKFYNTKITGNKNLSSWRCIVRTSVWRHAKKLKESKGSVMAHDRQKKEQSNDVYAALDVSHSPLTEFRSTACCGQWI